MHIDKRYDGANLCASGPLWLGTEAWPPKPIGKTVRIGIARGANRQFRFYERGNHCVSGPAHLLTHWAGGLKTPPENGR